MADIMTKSRRSALMAKVRSTGNGSTELRLIAVFRAHGVSGWRRGASLQFKTDKMKFKVRPDFVFRDRGLAVFVDGCFWHGCPVHATQPKTHAKFWREKIARNQARDRLVTRTLRRAGWRVLRVWEHELRGIPVDGGRLAEAGKRKIKPAARRNERRLLVRFRRYGLVR